MAKRADDMRLKLKFEYLSFGRGQWSYSLVEVNGHVLADPVTSDPCYSTEREARRAARSARWAFHSRLGWHTV